ncbi:CTC-interacting domain 4 isoform X2 [Wolffia australiana]
MLYFFPHFARSRLVALRLSLRLLFVGSLLRPQGRRSIGGVDPPRLQYSASDSASDLLFRAIHGMNLPPSPQSKSSANGFFPRRMDKEMTLRTDGRPQMAKSSYGLSNGANTGELETPSRDRLIFVSTCLIGHIVEVHVKNGSVLSGIFHTINVEKDFGLVLKMARITKDCAAKGPNHLSETVKRPQTMIIPARELVQVIAKDISLTNDAISSGNALEKHQDFMTDSAISQSRHVDVDRELQRWTPDEDDPRQPELENIFDRQWHRNWNQFEANEALFGVKSTFDEELYTTKLEKGPQMRDREREAMRIAKEIEGEDTRDAHLADERGIHLDEDLDFDEEARFSSVFRGIVGETRRVKDDFTPQPTSSSSSREEGESHSSDDVIKGFPRSNASHVKSLQANVPLKNIDFESLDGKQLEHHNGRNPEDEQNEIAVIQDTELLKFGDVPVDKCSSEKGALSARAVAYSPSLIHIKKDPAATNPHVAPLLRPSSSTSSTSEKSVETSTSSGGPNAPLSSSVGSIASEKSTLNPHAKEFKLNPNAKSFVPVSSARPPAAATESSFYYPQNPTLSQMHGLPVAVSMGPTFSGQQAVVYTPQGLQMQSAQGYINPTASMYGQQVIMGQPRPVIYMPGYTQDMNYKGREF